MTGLHLTMGPAPAFAQRTGTSSLQEGYTPAQHDTRWTGTIAELQAMCDVLATRGVQEGGALCLPFADLHASSALLIRRGALVLDIVSSLDKVYSSLRPPPVAALPILASVEISPAGRSWERIVRSNRLPPGALRLAALLRAAPLLPVVESTPFHCRLCGVPCSGWGRHVLRDCPLLPPALLAAFRDAAAALQHLYSIRWLSTTSFQTCNPTSTVTWTLIADMDLLPSRRADDTAYITWSGLLYPADSHPLPPCTHDRLSIALLRGIERWLRLPLSARWRLPAQLRPNAQPPAAILDLLTALRWLLQLPPSAVTGPWAALAGDLRPFEPIPPSPRPLLSCGELYSGPHPDPINILPCRPPSAPPHLITLHLPLNQASPVCVPQPPL